MPYLHTAQEWLSQSTLLLQARPATTRINTKYNLSNPTKTLSAMRKSARSKPRPKSDEVALAPTTKATLTLKTYDPVSGVTLKYETDKAAEVGRLVLACSRLGRTMAGLAELNDDAVMIDAGGELVDQGEVIGTAMPVPEAKAVAGGQGGKKKKKGKK